VALQPPRGAGEQPPRLDLILADHFSPAVALLAPLYWLWSDPIALLVAQAVLVAAAALPLFAFARRRVGAGPARLLAAAYLLFGGVQEAIWFDVHEVAFAPLAVGVAVWAADVQRWRTSFAATASLLLVEEDLALLVVAIGAWYLVCAAGGWPSRPPRSAWRGSR
jgi:uncharacterized membrane protein